MSSRQPLHRLFIALYPPEQAARGLLEQARRLAGDAHRFTPIEQVHLTLLFIGPASASELRDTIESTERATKGVGPFRLHPLELVALPNRDARLLAALTDAPSGLMELHARLARRLARPSQIRSRGGFSPHITLIRRSPGLPWPEAVLTAIEGLAFEVDHISLMSSVLRAGGAEHRVMHIARLG